MYFCFCHHLPPHTAINALSLHPAQFPSPSLPLSLSLIYIAMTPVSAMQAPCCEFHLSRKTSGDCYANGYVVGLVQEWKREKKMVMFVSSYVCVGRKPEQEEQERSGCNKKKKGCRGEESKERRMQTGWPDAMFLWRSITSNRALSLSICV